MTQDSTSQPPRPNARSAAVTAGPNRAAARSYLRAAGMQDADFDKPMIGIVNTWSTVTPCNMHLDRLAKDVRAGIVAAGGYPVDFNTIVVTDGQLHDAPALPATAPAPVHVLLTGQPSDWDRRLVVEEAPAFGLIGQPVTIRLRVEDQGAVPPEVQGRAVTLRVSIDGAREEVVAIPPGMPLDIPVTPEHPGQNVVAVAIDPPEGEPLQLTDLNDRAAIQIEGVRDRLQRAAASAWERALRQLSWRRWPPPGSATAAQSPAARICGSEVTSRPSVRMPSPVASPAARASAMSGATPMALTTSPAGTRPPEASSTPSASIPATVSPRRKQTPSARCRW